MLRLVLLSVGCATVWILTGGSQRSQPSNTTLMYNLASVNESIFNLGQMLKKPVFVAATLMLTFFGRNIVTAGQRAMSNSTGVYSVAYVTVPTQDVAKKIAHGLVRSKMAACVNIIPQITSVYEWKNEINEDNELLLMIKTRTETVDSLTKYVKENHPYEVCEVISLPIENGNDKYLSWIGEVVPSSSAKETAKESE